YKSVCSGKACRGSVHVTRRAPAAWIAAHSCSATTPTKSPFTTVFTNPGTAFAELSSMVTNVAPTPEGRITRPCNMPGTRTSVTYLNWPRIFGGRSARGAGFPTIVYVDGSFGLPGPSTFSENPSPETFS